MFKAEITASLIILPSITYSRCFVAYLYSSRGYNNRLRQCLRQPAFGRSLRVPLRLVLLTLTPVLRSINVLLLALSLVLSPSTCVFSFSQAQGMLHLSARRQLRARLPKLRPPRRMRVSLLMEERGYSTSFVRHRVSIICDRSIVAFYSSFHTFPPSYTTGSNQVLKVFGVRRWDVVEKYLDGEARSLRKVCNVTVCTAHCMELMFIVQYLFNSA